MGIACRLVSLTQPWLLSVLAASTFPPIPGGSAIPPAIRLAFAGSAIPLPSSPLALAGGARLQEQQESSLRSVPPCCCAGLGRWPCWTPLTHSFVSPYTRFPHQFILPRRTSSAFGSWWTHLSSASPIRDANRHFPSVPSYKSHRFIHPKSSSIKRLSQRRRVKTSGR